MDIHPRQENLPCRGEPILLRIRNNYDMRGSRFQFLILCELL